ncbi:hypothetical protein AAEX37_01945 [Oligella sp. MSHR50489EDL]|uniref:baseplate J/gp47 family protein n=1 Tax=Oligella sp. MSHR50489EDL TaxID=3139409 RepID=UPI003D81597F
MSVMPQLKVTPQGIVSPPIQDVINGLWVLFKDAFGHELNESMSSPQGQLITSLAAIIQDERNQLIELANNFDPRYAQGVFQDGLGAINFITRKKGTRSVVSLTFIGLTGTVIPKAYRVQDNNGNFWETLETKQISSDGKATIEAGAIEAGAIEAGAIEAGANTITTIIQQITGLDRVYNENPSLAGIAEESQEEFEIRRRESVAINSKGLNASAYGAILNIPDVLDVFVVDNPTDSTIKVGSTNYPIIRNSFLASVIGGDSEEIAKTILAKAGTGCSFEGNTEVVVYDDENFERNPPRYTVRFLRPDQIPIYIKIELNNKNIMTYRDEQNIINSVLNAFNKGSARARIGQELIASKYICAASNAVPHLDVVSLKISLDGNEFKEKLQIGVDQFPVLNELDISVV